MYFFTDYIVFITDNPEFVSLKRLLFVVFLSDYPIIVSLWMIQCFFCLFLQMIFFFLQIIQCLSVHIRSFLIFWCFVFFFKDDPMFLSSFLRPMSLMVDSGGSASAGGFKTLIFSCHLIACRVQLDQKYIFLMYSLRHVHVPLT